MLSWKGLGTVTANCRHPELQTGAEESERGSRFLKRSAKERGNRATIQDTIDRKQGRRKRKGPQRASQPQWRQDHTEGMVNA